MAEKKSGYGLGRETERDAMAEETKAKKQQVDIANDYVKKKVLALHLKNLKKVSKEM